MFFHFSGQLIVIAIFDGVDIPEEVPGCHLLQPWLTILTDLLS